MRIYSTRIKTIFSLVIAFCAVQLTAQSFNTMTITSPSSIAGDYSIVSADFGLDATAVIAGSLTLGVDDTSPEGDACTPLVNDLSGNIGLIDRGACEFGVKVLNAENAGAIAVLVCNNAPGSATAMGPGADGDQVTVYAAMATQADCNLIKAELENNDVSIMFSYLSPPCDAVYDSTVVWGANGEGQFDGGLGDWVSTGITAETDVFVHDPLGLNRGAIRNETYSIASPSVCNGAMIMDYDFLSTMGDGDILNALAFPYPEHSGNLISPTMDLSTADFPQCEFYTFQLPLNGTASFAYSIDDGENWTAEVNIPTWNILSASTDNVQGTELLVMQMPEAANQSEVRVRFTATGNDFYFWIIDDVIIKSFQKVDVRANPFYSVATNFKTPINQVDEMAFVIDVENVGNTDITNASMNVSIVNDDTSDEVYSADLDYGLVPAGFLDENRVFADKWLPTNEVGNYTGTYTLSSDNDEDFANNSQSFNYQITDEDFAKVMSEEEAGFAYLSDRAAPNEYFQSYGNYYYIPNGAGLIAKEVSFGVVVGDLAASSGFITLAMYQWFDTDESGTCEGTERLELYKEEILISDELTADGIRNMTFDLTDANIELTDDGHYLVMAHMRPLLSSGDQYRIVAANTTAEPNYSYAAVTLALSPDFMTLNRFGSLSGTGTDNTPQDVDTRVLSSNGSWSVYMPLKIGIFSDVDEVNNNLNVKIFPNPAVDKLIVDLILDNNSETVGLTLTSVDGKVLLNENAYNVQYDQIELDITNVPAGIYMLNVRTEDGYTSKKVVVSK